MDYLAFAKESIQTAHASFEEEEKNVIAAGVAQKQIPASALYARVIGYSLQSGIVASNVAIVEELKKLNRNLEAALAGLAAIASKTEKGAA